MAPHEVQLSIDINFCSSSSPPVSIGRTISPLRKKAIIPPTPRPQRPRVHPSKLLHFHCTAMMLALMYVRAKFLKSRTRRKKTRKQTLTRARFYGLYRSKKTICYDKQHQTLVFKPRRQATPLMKIKDYSLNSKRNLKQPKDPPRNSMRLALVPGDTWTVQPAATGHNLD